MSRQQTAPAQTEKEFQQAVVDALRVAGFTVYHTYDSRRSAPGFPDIVAVRPRTQQVLFREIKTEKGKVSIAQELWLDALQKAGADAGVWRPSDWKAIERTLARGSRS